MREEVEHEADERYEVGCQPCRQLLCDPITHRTLNVIVVETITLRDVLPGDYAVLIFLFDVWSIALEEVFLNSILKAKC